MGLKRIEVVGAGLAGAVAALMAAKQGHSVRLWGQAEDATARAVALSQPSLNRLAALGVDTQIGGSIEQIHVSRTGQLGYTQLASRAHGFTQFGRVIENSVVLDRVRQALNRYSIDVDTRNVEQVGAGWIEVQGQRHTGTVLLSAPVKSLIDGLGIITQKRALNDRLWVGIARASTQGVAYERFTSSGPLAVLPLGNDRVSLVWQVAGQVDLKRLNQAMGGRVCIHSIESQSEVPAMALWSETLIRPNLALVGSAAQVLHPVAGQGLNLILRQLADLFADGLNDLPAWQQRAIADRQRWMGTTLSLAGLFQTAWPGSGIALAGVGCVPGLSSEFVRRFMEGQ